MKSLRDIFETNGIPDKKSLLLARYIIEPQKEKELVLSEDISMSQKMIIAGLEGLIGHYKIYNDNNLAKKYTDILTKILHPCKNTLKDTLMLEDYDEEGTIPIGAMKEAFITLEVDIDEEVLDYLLFVVFSKSESTEKMRY